MEPALQFVSLGKIVIAAILGGVVGMERESAEKPAGLRTHMLVCAFSTFLVMLALELVSFLKPESLVRTDPIRIVEAIVVGISFLGAGTIVKSGKGGGKSVEGLTTSASILSVSAIGIAVALNAYILAVGVTSLNLFINWGVNYLFHLIKLKTK